MKGTLYLIPTILSEEALHVIPEYVHERTKKISVFFVENERTARRYLRKSGFTASFDETWVLPLNEHTPPEIISTYIRYLEEGKDAGIMSEAGVPAVADPGHLLVQLAHEAGIRVVPLVGPSSILLALMASGMNGQQFVFHGYIPVKQPERNRYIQKMGVEARSGITQIFIETPYRNNSIVQDIIKNCSPTIRLCVAMDLTGNSESVITKTVGDWKTFNWEPAKLPAIFLLGR